MAALRTREEKHRTSAPAAQADILTAPDHAGAWLSGARDDQTDAMSDAELGGCCESE